MKHQPAKLAAIEAHWQREAHAPLTLFAIPDEAQETNRAALDVPELGSIILAHDAAGEVPGLKDFPRDQRPPVAIPFFAFRIMVGVGMLMLGIVVTGNLLRAGGRVFRTQWFLRLCEYGGALGFIAVLAGWTVTEVGRQPWTVYGLMRTRDSVTPSLQGGDVLLSLIGYMVAYLIMFPAGALLMVRLVRGGFTPQEAPIESGRPHGPIDALVPAREGDGP